MGSRSKPGLRPRPDHHKQCRPLLEESCRPRDPGRRSPSESRRRPAALRLAAAGLASVDDALFAETTRPTLKVTRRMIVRIAPHISGAVDVAPPPARCPHSPSAAGNRHPRRQRRRWRKQPRSATAKCNSVAVEPGCRVTAGMGWPPLGSGAAPLAGGKHVHAARLRRRWPSAACPTAGSRTRRARRAGCEIARSLPRTLRCGAAVLLSPAYVRSFRSSRHPPTARAESRDRKPALAAGSKIGRTSRLCRTTGAKYARSRRASGTMGARRSAIVLIRTPPLDRRRWSRWRRAPGE